MLGLARGRPPAPHRSVDTIASRHNPLVARARRLARDRTGEPAMLLDGLHLVEMAVTAGVIPELAAFARVLLERDPAAASLAVRLERLGCRVVQVSQPVADAMSPVRTPSGVVAIAPAPPCEWARVLAAQPALVVVAVDVQDPGNLGAIVRVVDAAGGTGVVCAGGSADPFGWKALRGAMGSTLRVPLVREADPAAAVARLRSAGLRVLASEGGATLAPHDVDLRNAVAVLVGSEGQGIGADVAALADARIGIPMRPGVESLNVATATAVIAYEARRQRGARPADDRDHR
jgi:TrmH family RNA methyltransferase